MRMYRRKPARTSMGSSSDRTVRWRAVARTEKGMMESPQSLPRFVLVPFGNTVTGSANQQPATARTGVAFRGTSGS
jgi:hypothetical protein